MNYYRRYIGDFQADTMALSMLEQGAYDRLLDYYYATEKPIPLNTDRAAIICRAITLEERAAVQAVLEGYFERREDGWHNKRADHEIEVSKTARENGGKGGRPTKPDAPNPKTGMETEHETGNITGLITGEITGMGGGSGHPPTTNHQPRTKPKPSSASADYAAGFLRFWKAWPSHKRKIGKFKAFALWRGMKLEPITDEIVAHVEAMKPSDHWREGFVPLPETYLRNRRWEDGTASGARSGRDEFAGAI